MTIESTYAHQRDQLNEAIAGEAPAELVSGLAAAARRLDALDFASRAVQTGDHAPDFTLPDHRGQEVSLSALLGKGPIVLIFYRGEWCPYCNLQLRTFQAQLQQLAAHGAQLVAISPQTPDHSLSMAERNELGFLVLSDVGANVIARYGLLYEVHDELGQLLQATGNNLGEYNGERGWSLPAPATYVIARDGDVRYAHVRGDWTERAEASDVLAALAAIDLRDAA